MRIAVGAALLALAGCGAPPSGNEQAARTPAGDAPYYKDLPIRELMVHVIQHSADEVWSRQGFEIDARGERSLFPKNPQEWEEAESAALTLAEVSNTLLVPGRRVPEAEWDHSVKQVREIAVEMAKAAEKHDKDAFFAAGGKLDAACDACHARYDPRFDPRFQH